MVFNFLFPKTTKPSSATTTTTSSSSIIEAPLQPQSPALEIDPVASSSTTTTTTPQEQEQEQQQPQEQDAKMSTSRSSSSLESGYVSGTSSTSSSTPALPQIVLTREHLQFINNTLNNLTPLEILRWCKITFPNLYQITAFGLSGLVTLDMLSKLAAETPDAPSIDAIFFDTLYHFQETLDLVERTKAQYPNVRLHVYKPEGSASVAEFEARHGTELWKADDKLYDWIAKVEPAQRAYSDLAVAAVLTGRRRSQGAKRSSLEIIEIDEAGLIKINPLASWSFAQVKAYVKANNVPYNALLDRGYKSVGDWHSTEPVAEGEDERSGRWKGQQKTECGIHNRPSKYAQFLKKVAAEEEEKKRREAEAESLAERLGGVAVGQEGIVV